MRDFCVSIEAYQKVSLTLALLLLMKALSPLLSVPHLALISAYRDTDSNREETESQPHHNNNSSVIKIAINI